MEVHDWFGLAFGAIGVGAFYQDWKIRTKAEDSKLWPSVPGKVHKSTMVLESGGGGYGSHSPSTYKAVVQYKYKVASRHYTNNKICIGGQLQLSFKKRAGAHCQNYPVGSAVDVYYDPNKPQDSVLETREEISRILQIVGGAFMFFGVLAYLGVFR